MLLVGNFISLTDTLELVHSHTYDVFLLYVFEPIISCIVTQVSCVMLLRHFLNRHGTEPF